MTGLRAQQILGMSGMGQRTSAQQTSTVPFQAPTVPGALQATTVGIDMSEMMNLMITMMIIGMMMKMMTGMMKSAD